jgi:hypothetical protein
MVLMLRVGPLAICAKTGPGEDAATNPAMPPATERRKSRRPFSTL